MTTNTSVGMKWEYAFDKSWVVDDEGDTLSYSYNLSPVYTWLSAVENSTHYVLSGTPLLTEHAQTYNLRIIVDDEHTDVDEFIVINIQMLITMNSVQALKYYPIYLQQFNQCLMFLCWRLMEKPGVMVPH